MHADDIRRGALECGMKKSNITEFKDKHDIIFFLKGQIAKNDTVLVKGSRFMRMEEIVEALLLICGPEKE
jgi:UDP-N-acetylmuramyl pentapeptide synthase